jgi:hypothetical protein
LDELLEDGSNSHLGCVCHDACWCVLLRVYQEGGVGQGVLDSGEGVRAGVVPGEGGIPFGACQESVEGFDDGSTVGDEPMVKID